ncbi:MAG: tRNA glutamyl-Q(34) synthetase GluQRS [Pseudomonadales bacterium]|nr:tRNA glutamyl-Q(34) synthetase GluQRS [Pseudomonadales bacterium]
MITYTGRFAPTPSGPLHQGSLLTALASYLDARANKGNWLVRVDDLDTPRNQPGATDLILSSLERHGLLWDGEILYQSSRIDAYQTALSKLIETQRVFFCNCSRKLLQGTSIYPGTCRKNTIPAFENLALNTKNSGALRIQVKHADIHLNDLIQGHSKCTLRQDGGDFIVFRRDGIYSYHLCTVIDDSYQGISHVIRGADLLESTAQQIYLSQLMGISPPIYAHIPVIIDDRGHKLSKHSQPQSIDDSPPVDNLFDCLVRLGQNPPMHLQYQSVTSVLQWGVDNWQINLIPAIKHYSYQPLAKRQRSKMHDD